MVEWIYEIEKGMTVYVRSVAVGRGTPPRKTLVTNVGRKWVRVGGGRASLEELREKGYTGLYSDRFDDHYRVGTVFLSLPILVELDECERLRALLIGALDRREVFSSGQYANALAALGVDYSEKKM